MAAYFQCCNRNKSSLVLDLKDPAHYQKLLDLAAKADVVLDNFPPALKKRLNLEDEILRQCNPGLVTLNITGYSGERQNDPGYDVMIQAESGIMGITGPPTGPPYKVGVAVVDVLTGMMAANGILAALYRKARTGIGAALSISLYRTALLSLVNVSTNHLVSGRESQRWGNAHPNIVPYEPFQLADRTILLGAGNDSQFKRLCDLVGIDDPAILKLDNPGRLAARDRLVDLFQQKLARRQSQDILAQLKENGIPAAPILRPDEALAAIRGWDPDALLALEHKQLGKMELVNNSLVGEGMRQTHLAPPRLGENGQQLAQTWLAD